MTAIDPRRHGRLWRAAGAGADMVMQRFEGARALMELAMKATNGGSQKLTIIPNDHDSAHGFPDEPRPVHGHGQVYVVVSTGVETWGGIKIETN